MLGRWSYLAGGMAIHVKGRQVSRNVAPILVFAPHSTFLDTFVVYVTNMCSVIVRNESRGNYMGSKFCIFFLIYSLSISPGGRNFFHTVK